MERRVSPGRRLSDAGRHPRALIVDPHRDTQELVDYCLEVQGFSTTRASDGAEAFEAAVRRLPDLIVTELALPDCDGLLLIDRLRAEPSTRDIPILVVTSLAQETMLTRAREHGASASLAKPVLPEHMMAVVGGLMDAADPAAIVERQLRRVLLTLRSMAGRYQASAEVRQQLGQIVDRLQEAVLLLDSSGRLLASSPAATKVTGAIDASLAPVRLLIESLNAQAPGAPAEESPQVEHWSGDASVVRSDGHQQPVRAVYMAAGVDGLHVAALMPPLQNPAVRPQ